MWFVHAGHRVDAAHRPRPRFPTADVAPFEHRLRRFLDTARPSGVVSAAAAGADLLVLDVARELGIRVEVVLPLPLHEFVSRSVADRGPEWVARFHRVLPDPQDATIVDLSAHDDWYLRGNDAVLDHATAVADGEGILAVVARTGGRDDAASASDDFARRARRRRITTIDLDPAAQAGVRASAAIASDVTFGKVIVPLLEDADLDWTRVESSTAHVLVGATTIELPELADAAVTDDEALAAIHRLGPAIRAAAAAGRAS